MTSDHELIKEDGCTQVWIDAVEELLHRLGCLTVDFLEEMRTVFFERRYGRRCISAVYRVRDKQGGDG